MLLKSRDGASVELRVLGYEYPLIEDKKTDSNWLSVFCSVHLGPDVWSFTGKSLLSWEARDLARWLETISGPGMSEGRLAFTEPHLRFEAKQLSEQLRVLKVSHRYSAGSNSMSIEAELIIEREALQIASQTFLQEAGRFPPRAGVS